MPSVGGATIIMTAQHGDRSISVARRTIGHRWVEHGETPQLAIHSPHTSSRDREDQSGKKHKKQGGNSRKGSNEKATPKKQGGVTTSRILYFIWWFGMILHLGIRTRYISLILKMQTEFLSKFLIYYYSWTTPNTGKGELHAHASIRDFGCLSCSCRSQCVGRHYNRLLGIFTSKSAKSRGSGCHLNPILTLDTPYGLKMATTDGKPSTTERAVKSKWILCLFW